MKKLSDNQLDYVKSVVYGHMLQAIEAYHFQISHEQAEAIVEVVCCMVESYAKPMEEPAHDNVS